MPSAWTNLRLDVVCKKTQLQWNTDGNLHALLNGVHWNDLECPCERKVFDLKWLWYGIVWYSRV